MADEGTSVAEHSELVKEMINLKQVLANSLREVYQHHPYTDHVCSECSQELEEKASSPAFFGILDPSYAVEEPTKTTLLARITRYFRRTN